MRILPTLHYSALLCAILHYSAMNHPTPSTPKPLTDEQMQRFLKRFDAFDAAMRELEREYRTLVNDMHAVRDRVQTKQTLEHLLRQE